MKLSMSILTWALRDFHPESHISNDGLSLEGVRFLGIEDTVRMPQYVYIGTMSDYFPGTEENSYICMNKDSYILVEHCKLEQVLNTILSAFDYYQNWEKRLESYAAGHAPISRFMELRNEILEDPFYIQGMDSSLIAISEKGPFNLENQWSEFKTTGNMTGAIGASLIYDQNDNMVSDFTFRTVFIKRLSSDSLDMFASYLRQNNERVAGFVTWYQTKAPESMHMQINDFLARYLVQAEEFTSDNSAHKAKPIMFADILAGKEITDDVLISFENRNEMTSYRLCSLHSSVRKDIIRRNYLISQMRRMGGFCYPFVFEEKLLVLVKEESLKTFTERLPSLVSLEEISVNVSAPVSGLRHLKTAYQQTVFCEEQSLNKNGIHYCKDYSFPYFIKMLAENENADMLLHPAVSILKVYDLENNTDLSQTLWEYLQCGLSMTDTADELHVHRNTMKYRIGRIRELTDINFRNPEELAFLNLSFYIQKELSEKMTEEI